MTRTRVVITAASRRSSRGLRLPAALLSFALCQGCNPNQTRMHPAVSGQVSEALTDHNLGMLHVSEDRKTGVLTLTGTVSSQQQKTQAVTILHDNAPEYRVDDKVEVHTPVPPPPPDEATDDAIERNFSGAIDKQANLKAQRIHGSVHNGVLTLEGAVETKEQRQEAESVANTVPHVKHVIDDITVHPGGFRTDSSAPNS